MRTIDELRASIQHKALELWQLPDSVAERIPEELEAADKALDAALTEAEGQRQDEEERDQQPDLIREMTEDRPDFPGWDAL